MKKFAIYSSDPADYYSSLLPIEALAWARMGYQPVSLLYGSYEQWMANPKTRLIYELIEPISEIHYIDPVVGWSCPTISRTCRLFGAALPSISDEDYVLMSDVDMIPLDAAYFNHQDFTKSFNIFSANGYTSNIEKFWPSKFAMCYIAGKASAWSDVLGFRSKDLNLELQRSCAVRFDHFDNDEMYFIGKLHEHPTVFKGPLEKKSEMYFQKGDCQLILRVFRNEVATRRLDRVHWRYNGEKDLIDCHAHRPGWERFDVLGRLMAVYFPKDTDFFSSYFEKYLYLKRTTG